MSWIYSWIYAQVGWHGRDRNHGQGWSSARVALTFWLTTAGCSEVAAPLPGVHEVEVSPPAAVLEVRDTVRLTAHTRGEDGSPRSGVVVEWSSLDPQRATVSGAANTGLVLAHRAGVVVITAWAGGKVGVSTLDIRNPVPTVSALSPGSVVAGTAGLTLTVLGSGFVEGSQVLWDGAARPTQYVGPAQLRLVLEPADLWQPAEVDVRVSTAAPGGGTSEPLVFTVAEPSLRIVSLDPDSAESQPGAIEIRVRGSGFHEGAHALWNGGSRPSQVLSETEMTIFLWEGDLANSGTRQVEVRAPGGDGSGERSNALPFRIVPGVWSVTVGPQPDELWPGEERQVHATALDEQGRVLSGRPVTWTSSSPEVATVDPGGHVRAVSAGVALIEARVGSRVGWTSVRVLETLPYDLLYEGTGGGLRELWLLAIAPGAAPRRLLPPGTYGAEPAGSPDGSRIAFVGVGSTGLPALFVVDRDGENLRQLTDGEEVDDQPAWSRDGTRIAYRGVREGVSDIWVVHADGTGRANLTHNALRPGGPWGVERPTWTPSGRIVFAHGPELLSPRSYRLASVNADGSDWQDLTTGEFRDHEPEVSPNGALIALRRGGPVGDFIDIISSDGSGLGWVFWPGPGRTPSWSPEGRFLTYWRPNAPGDGRILLWELGITGYERVLVPSGGRNPKLLPRN